MRMGSFGHCTLCNKPIEWGPVVAAEFNGAEPVSYVHGQCWVDAGRKVILPTGAFHDSMDNSWVPEHALDADSAN